MFTYDLIQLQNQRNRTEWFILDLNTRFIVIDTIYTKKKTANMVEEDKASEISLHKLQPLKLSESETLLRSRWSSA